MVDSIRLCDFPVVLAIRWKLKLLGVNMDSFIRSDWFDRVRSRLVELIMVTVLFGFIGSKVE